MFRTDHLCLLALTSLIFLGLNSLPVHAQDQPTREHQFLYSSDYVPLKRQAEAGGQPVLTATVGGTQTMNVMVDTGATFSVLSPEIVKQLDLKTEPAFLGNGKPFFWKGKQGTATSLSNFKVSNIIYTTIPFRVLPDQDFILSPKAPDDTRYDGIIGTDVFEQFAVLLDPAHHKFSFCRPGNFSLYQVAQLGMVKPYIVPITEGSNGQWYAEAQVTNNGIVARETLVLDTGSNVTQISDTTAQNLHLKIIGQQQQQDAHRVGLVGIANAGMLRLGDLILPNVSVSISPITKNELPLLGMDILSGYKVLMDFPGGKMYLQSNTDADVPAVTIGPASAPAAPPAK